jgi:hypothetical protein
MCQQREPLLRYGSALLRRRHAGVQGPHPNPPHVIVISLLTFSAARRGYNVGLDARSRGRPCYVISRRVLRHHALKQILYDTVYIKYMRHNTLYDTYTYMNFEVYITNVLCFKIHTSMYFKIHIGLRVTLRTVSQNLLPSTDTVDEARWDEYGVHGTGRRRTSAGWRSPGPPFLRKCAPFHFRC